MPHQRSDEAERWYSMVYMAVQEIPYGKVTTYGHIARLIGEPQRPRQVGQALKHLPSPLDADGNANTFHNDNVPWQRVISSAGIISQREDPSGQARQAQRLRAEGVEVTELNGEFRVDLKSICGWFPQTLPSDGDREEGGNV